MRLFKMNNEDYKRAITFLKSRDNYEYYLNSLTKNKHNNAVRFANYILISENRKGHFLNA